MQNTVTFLFGLGLDLAQSIMTPTQLSYAIQEIRSD